VADKPPAMAINIAHFVTFMVRYSNPLRKRGAVCLTHYAEKKKRYAGKHASKQQPPQSLLEFDAAISHRRCLKRNSSVFKYIDDRRKDNFQLFGKS
jgi:hypothetical protein